MTPEQKRTVKRTWKMITPIATTAADLFYDKLFEIDPSLDVLFDGVDLASQKQKLLQALATTVAGLDAPEDLISRLSDLGRRHASYGVVDAHYEIVGRSLMWTLEQGLRDEWTPQAQEAWTAAYTFVSETMKVGARSHASDLSQPQHEAA